MTNDQLFSTAIDLYKSFNNKIKASNGFLQLSDSFNLTAQQAEILKTVYKNRDKFKSFRLTIDHETIDLESNITENALCSELKIELSPYSHCNFSFYSNEYEMLKRLSVALLHGKLLPELYYLIDIDYRSNSDLVIESELKLHTVTKWISFFRKISDIQKETTTGVCLYFLIKSGSDKFTQPLEVSISNIEEICNLPKISAVDDIEMLINDAEVGNLHSKDKQSFFKLALVDVIKSSNESNPSSILGKALFYNLDKIKKCYYEHYEVFIHNFAIGEFQQQVQDKWFDFSEKINGVLSDIKSKLYAVPIALVSLGTLSTLSDVYSYIFICTGVFITGAINLWMVNDQEERLKQIKYSSIQTFEKIKKINLDSSNPSETFNTVNEATKNISDRIATGESKIQIYKILCWLPTAIMLTLYFLKERNRILDIINIDSNLINNKLIELTIKTLARFIKYFIS